MPNSAWIERDVPLERCPVGACRRSRTCRHPTDKDPCRRLYQSRDSFYLQLAEKIERLTEEIIASRPPGVVVEEARPGTLEFERRLKFLYDSVRERDIAQSAEETARLARKEKEQPHQKGSPGQARR